MATGDGDPPFDADCLWCASILCCFACLQGHHNQGPTRKGVQRTLALGLLLDGQNPRQAPARIAGLHL